MAQDKPAPQTARTYPVAASVMADLGFLQMLMPMEGHDMAGRSLLEGRSLIDPPGPENYRQCRYLGCRRLHENPMNVGALRIYMDSRAAIDGWLRILSATQPDQPAGARLLFAAHSGYHAPKLWLHGCLPGPVPPSIATAAKISHGVYELALDVVRRKGFGWLQTADSSTLSAHAEDHARIVGRKEVCAGPPDVIVAVLAILLGEDRQTNAPDPATDDLTRLARHAMQTGALMWCLERLAITQTMYRMTHTQKDPQIKVTFPNAVTTIDAFMRHIPLDTTLVSAYKYSPPTEDAELRKANTALDQFSGIWLQKLRSLSLPDNAFENFDAWHLAQVMQTIHDRSRLLGFHEFHGFSAKSALNLLF